MNKLQTIVGEFGDSSASIYEDVLRLLKDGSTIDEAFKGAQYTERMADEITGVAMASMQHGTWRTDVEILSDKAEHWYLHTDHQGGALSDTLRNSGAKAQIRKTYKEFFSFKSSAQQLARELPTGQNGKLPRAATDLINKYKGGNADMTRAVSQLRSYNAKSDSVFLKDAYNALADAVEKNSDILLEKAVSRAMKSKVAYINNRIARTESARAYNMSRNRSYELDENVIGWRWVLSPAHPVVDICDYCADADIYGMGAGVYPVNAGPSIPAHPNCLCMSEPVKRTIGRKIGRSSEERREESIKSAAQKGYSEKRLRKDITRLSNNTTNKLPLSVVEVKKKTL